MYICVTHVDAQTKIPGHKRPMYNGPTFPDVKGLQIEWWDQSNWPLTHPDQYPRFYGTCDDDADITIEGIVSILEEENYNELKDMEMRARLPSVASPRQIRLALLKLGMLDTIQQSFNSLEEEVRKVVMIEWEYATEFYKNSPTVTKIAEMLNISQEQLDNIFTVASEIGNDPLSQLEEEQNGN
jgi:hypothetical protein